MRLRKNMKRTAAAALALSVALSAAAPTALAKDYYIENGDITVTVTEEGDTYVRVGKATNKDDIGVKDDTAVVIKGGKDPSKPAGTNSDGSADEAEGQKPVVDAEPGEPAENTGTELIVWPEDANSGEAQEKDDPEPEAGEPDTPDTPDTQKPEGKTDAATLEASTEQKPVEEAAEDDEDDEDIMTFEANTASTVTTAVSEAMNRFIKIFNNCTTEKDTTVTIENVNIYQYGNYKAAMEVRGAGDTTLKLKGDNILKSGYWVAGLEKNDKDSTGKLTITAEDANASLKAVGGQNSAGIGGGDGESTSKLEIANGKIHAVCGFENYAAGIGGGWNGNGEVTISGGEVTAQGATGAAGIGGGYGGSGKVTIKNGKVTAKTRGNAAAIGGGTNGSGDVTILDGTVTTTGNSRYYPVTGIGGATGSTKKSTVRILGGVVNAVGGGYGSGIGGGKGGVEVEIGGGAQVTAKGGKGGTYSHETYGAGAAIGTAGDVGGKAGKEQDVNAIGEGTVTRVDPNLPADHTHEWTFVSSTLVADGQLDKKEYECPSCDSTRAVYKFVLPEPAPVEEEQNGRIVLRVIDAPYEMHQESTRYIVTADSDTATLFGCLGNLAELKAQGVDTLVFRTKSRETALDIDAMLSLGVEDTLFTLTHSGSSATLTVGGADHSELIH